jgi:hypothetical protein
MSATNLYVNMKNVKFVPRTGLMTCDETTTKVSKIKIKKVQISDKCILIDSEFKGINDLFQQLTKLFPNELKISPTNPGISATRLLELIQKKLKKYLLSVDVVLENGENKIFINR